MIALGEGEGILGVMIQDDKAFKIPQGGTKMDRRARKWEPKHYGNLPGYLDPLALSMLKISEPSNSRPSSKTESNSLRRLRLTTGAQKHMEPFNQLYFLGSNFFLGDNGIAIGSRQLRCKVPGSDDLMTFI